MHKNIGNIYEHRKHIEHLEYLDQYYMARFVLYVTLRCPGLFARGRFLASLKSSQQEQVHRSHFIAGC